MSNRTWGRFMENDKFEEFCVNTKSMVLSKLWPVVLEHATRYHTIHVAETGPQTFCFATAREDGYRRSTFIPSTVE